MPVKKDLPKRYHLNQPELAQAVAAELRTCQDVKSQRRLLAARRAAAFGLVFRTIPSNLAPTMRAPFLLLVGLLVSSVRAAEVPPATNEVPWSVNATNAEGATVARITVDTSEVPDLAAWGRHAGALCAEWYPKITALLASEGFTPPRSVTLRFRRDMRGVAATGGNRISIAAGYVRDHTNDWGMVIHELTHVVQSYPEPESGCAKPGWLVEGIADYIRLAHFEPQARRPRINPDRASYRDAYKTTAGFLEWAEKTHDPHLVQQLNQPLREGKFKLELFKEYTGKTVDELWQEFADSLRARTQPAGA